MVATSRAAARLPAKLVAILIAMVSASSEAATTNHPFERGVEAYRLLHTFDELALTDDGKLLVLVVSARATSPIAYSGRLDGEHSLQEAPALSGARKLRWIGGTHRLAFLSDRLQSNQIGVLDADTGQEHAIACGQQPLVDFSFAPNGEWVVCQSRNPGSPAQSFYERLQSSQTGIVVDPDSVNLRSYLDPTFSTDDRSNTVEVMSLSSRRLMEVPADGEIEFGSISWAPNNRQFSFTYLSRANAQLARRTLMPMTSVATFVVPSGAVRTISAAQALGDEPTSYSSGPWIDERRLMLFRARGSDPWNSPYFQEWTAREVIAGRSSPWRAFEFYSAAFTARGPNIFVEDTAGGLRSFARLTDAGYEATTITPCPGNVSLVRLSSDARIAAYVCESLDQPPEVYVSDAASGVARQLTTLNAALDSPPYRSRAISWRADDGTQLFGWLIEPRSLSAPAPMLTYVHGGPGHAMTNRFSEVYRDFWPYPLEVFAARGYVVFIPNYRGTHSYGRTYGIPPDQVDAPTRDVLSGVEYLVQSGVADAAHLGILGHSHGARLGPLAMARRHAFAAASFAEGIANFVVTYELQRDSLNRVVHDRYTGGGVSLYEDPSSYIAASPDLQFHGLRTPVLFEGGSRSLAPTMLGFLKAARRQGAPAEFIVYPRTGHLISEESLHLEAGARNLAWFEFWMRGRSDDVLPADRARWEGLRHGSR